MPFAHVLHHTHTCTHARARAHTHTPSPRYTGRTYRVFCEFAIIDGQLRLMERQADLRDVRPTPRPLLLNPRPKTLPGDGTLARIKTHLRYDGGAPSPLVRRLGNPYIQGNLFAFTSTSLHFM